MGPIVGVRPLDHPRLEMNLEVAVCRFSVFRLDYSNGGRKFECPPAPRQLALDGEREVLEPVSKKVPLILGEPRRNA